MARRPRRGKRWAPHPGRRGKDKRGASPWGPGGGGAPAWPSGRGGGREGKTPRGGKARVAARGRREKERGGGIAGGRGVGGVRGGLGYRPGERGAYRHFETVRLVVRVRNVGREE